MCQSTAFTELDVDAINVVVSKSAFRGKSSTELQSRLPQQHNERERERERRFSPHFGNSLAVKLNAAETLIINTGGNCIAVIDDTFSTQISRLTKVWHVKIGYTSHSFDC